MCGRYATTSTSAALLGAFEAELGAAAEDIGVDYNVAPTKTAPIVMGRAVGEGLPVVRELTTASWGLVPSWAKDRSMGSRLINARAETVDNKPSFRNAFARRRALIPAGGYYEWYQPPTHGSAKPAKQPFYLSAPDQGVLALAGLYEVWRPRGEDQANWLLTFTILTTAAEDSVGRIHDRAPLLVAPEDFDVWLHPAPRPAAELIGLLTPATPGRLQAWPVSTAVNNVRNNGPELVRPLPTE